MFIAELLGTASIVNCTEIYPKMLDNPGGKKLLALIRGC